MENAIDRMVVDGKTVRNGAKGVSVNSDGDLVIDVKFMGTVVIFR